MDKKTKQKKLHVFFKSFSSVESYLQHHVESRGNMKAVGEEEMMKDKAGQ